MPFQPTAPVLRVCLPDDTTVLGVKHYSIHFKDDAQFKQAITTLYSPPTPPNNSIGASSKYESAKSRLSTPGLIDSSEAGEFSGPPSPILDPQHEKIMQDREDTLSILEGKKTPRPNHDYGNAQHKFLFDAWAGNMQKPQRKPIVPDSQPSKTNPIFTWSAFHRILLSQMCPRDQRAFPEVTAELVPSILFLGKMGDGHVVKSRAPLVGESAKFFEALMLDVMVRGWTDVLWLGREGDQAPTEMRHDGIVLTWGAGMF